MATMFAKYFLNMVNAHETKKACNETLQTNYIYEGYEMIHFMALILFTGILVWLGMRCFGILSISSITDSSPQKSTRECSAQTDRTGPEEERFLELRKGQDEVVIFVMNGTIRIAAIK